MLIRIRQYTFTISAPFFPGQVITAAEAQALNALRAENIRNNFAKRVLDSIASLPEGQLLSAEAQAEAQQALDSYSSTYQFQLRHESRVRESSVEAEARQLAQDEVLTERRRLGEPTEGPTVEVEVELLMASSEIQRRARERVALRLQTTTADLGELL